MAAEHATKRSLSSRGQRGPCVAPGLHPATGTGFISIVNGGERRLATRQDGYRPVDGAVGIGEPGERCFNRHEAADGVAMVLRRIGRPWRTRSLWACFVKLPRRSSSSKKTRHSQHLV